MENKKIYTEEEIEEENIQWARFLYKLWVKRKKERDEKQQD